MGAERSASVVNRKKYRFIPSSCEILLWPAVGMVAGEEETVSSFQEATQRADHSAWTCLQWGGIWAWQLTPRVHLGNPPTRQGSTWTCSNCICRFKPLLPWPNFAMLKLISYLNRFSLNPHWINGGLISRIQYRTVLFDFGFVLISSS